MSKTYEEIEAENLFLLAEKMIIKKAVNRFLEPENIEELIDDPNISGKEQQLVVALLKWVREP